MPIQHINQTQWKLKDIDHQSRMNYAKTTYTSFSTYYSLQLHFIKQHQSWARQQQSFQQMSQSDIYVKVTKPCNDNSIHNRIEAESQVTLHNNKAGGGR